MLSAVVSLVVLGCALAQKESYSPECYDLAAWQAALTKCYTDQGLTIKLQDFSKDGDSKDPGDSKTKRDWNWDGSKEGNWSKEGWNLNGTKDGNWSKDGWNWGGKDGNWSKEGHLVGKRDASLDVKGNYSKDGYNWDGLKDGNWSKDGNWTKDGWNWDGIKNGNWSKDGWDGSKDGFLVGKRDLGLDIGGLNGVSPDEFCANRAAYDAASTCTLALSVKCTPQDYAGLLPDANNLQMMGNVMCNNLNQINHLCTMNNTDDILACTKAKYQQITLAEANDPMRSACVVFDHTEQCLEEEIQECGQGNLDIQKQLNQLAKPIGCRTIGK